MHFFGICLCLSAEFFLRIQIRMVFKGGALGNNNVI